GPEIGAPAPVPGVDFTCAPQAIRREVWRSQSADAWTYYQQELFAVRFADPSALETLVQAHPSDLRWAEPAELRAGKLADGSSVAPFPVTTLALDGAFDEIHHG